MRKLILAAFICGLSLSLITPGFAKDEEDPDRIVNTEISRSHHKFKRGAINIVTFPLEIFKRTSEEIDTGKTTPQKLGRIVPGIFKGMGYSVVRLGSGVWDVVTFNNFFYEEHEPVLKPDYVWDKEEE